MANLGDLFKDLGAKDGGAVQKTADGIGASLGIVADASGAVGGGVALLQAFGVLSSDDDEIKDMLNQIQQQLNQIQTELQQLKAQATASDKLQRMRDVDNGINPAVGVFEQLPAILSSTPLPTTDFKLTQIQTCVDAVLFFSDFDEKWQVVQSDMPYYSDSWNGTLAPSQTSDNLVFNYTYTLPQFMRAIYILITTIAALEPKSMSSYNDVFNKCINRLQTVLQTVETSGIVASRLPPTQEWTGWRIYNDDGSMLMYPYGAVEIYSGASLMRSYQNDFFDFENVDLAGFGPSMNNFMELLQLRITKEKKALFSQLSFPAVEQAITQLQQLAGQSAAAIAPYETWPFDEVTSLLNLTLAAPPRPTPPVIGSEPAGLEPALRNFLQHTPPYMPFPVFNDEREPGSGTHGPNPTMMHAAVKLPTTSLYTFLTGVSLREVADAGVIAHPTGSA